MYTFGWLSVLVALLVIVLLDAPRPLVASLVTLALWVPLQASINRWVTKISGHAAVAVGCFTGLLLLGRLTDPLVVVTLVVLIALTLWARVMTGKHTVTQVLLGGLVGALPVLLIFPWLLP